jgi:lysozyme family protein
VNQDIYNRFASQIEGREDEKVPGDNGGRTVFGIDEASNPGDVIFALADAAEAAGRSVATDPDVNARAYAYYSAKWADWDIDYLPAPLQTSVFGACVNEGPGETFLTLQRCLTEMGQPIKADGQMGPTTLAAVGKVPTDALVDKFWRKRVEFYLTDANKHASQIKFLLGWENRVEEGF